MPRRLVYASRATRAFPEEHLAELLEGSRRRNAATGVTGMLVYADGEFLQVLEGEPDAVGRLYETIRADRRHGACRVLSDTVDEQRAFGEWTMGFHAMSKAQLAGMPGFTELFDEARPAPLRHPTSAAQMLLLAFRSLHAEPRR